MTGWVIRDWDDAYENGRNIPDGASWPARWVAPAQAFRDRGNNRLDMAYGKTKRSRYDLFLPQGTAKGLFIFVHGGYWVALDKSYWSHLAAGAVAAGWAVAIPSYDLCPQVSIADITAQIGAAIDHAATQVSGPIVLSGHSAGGHLVSAMMCTDSPLAPDTQARLRHVVSISGLHDLRPLLLTNRNATLRMDAASAAAGSPALKEPLPHVRLTTWVGGGERQEFLRQTRLLANIWHGLGCDTRAVIEPDRHHFNVIDGLADMASPLTRAAVHDPVSG
ncbi:alpha/beta hydrolase [Puniceibacterium sp. IMCC21224]|uniref:alpha/beta hydrolase n=1 Tax=Puniceibacterium sp. IMCC21224 TaxID=1618204 RepID=UPI00064D8DA5|nr:alpha/beta hydrolase [Puniceibacterium sp. IMCC21224]KMK67927.1 esterase/lipase [Puniceibacterium sp. IMCC21224]